MFLPALWTRISIGPNAFVVVSEAHEVLGEGFRPVAEEG